MIRLKRKRWINTVTCSTGAAPADAGAYNNWPQQIGIARSPDGLHWERMQSEPFLKNGDPGSWNASESGHPHIFEDDNRQTYLFYQGNNDKGRTWLLSNAKLSWKKNRPLLP